jgi:hypothetical protein
MGVSYVRVHQVENIAVKKMMKRNVFDFE